MSKGAQIAGGATVIALLFGWYAWTNLEAGASFAYYQSLAEFTASQDAQTGRHARVHGYVAEGTIERDVPGQQVAFAVQAAPHAGGPPGPLLPVVFSSLETPDLFKDGAEVVLEGRYLATGADPHFRADKVMAKCPSKFEGMEGDGPTRSASLN